MLRCPVRIRTVIPKLLGAVLSTVIVTAYPVCTEATTVTLFPNGARVQCSKTLSVENGKISLVLPWEASSPILVLEKGYILGQYEDPIFSMPSSDLGEETKALLKAVEDAGTQVANLQGTLAAINARIELWSKQPMPVDPEEINTLDTRLERILPALYVEQAQLKRKLEEAQNQENELKKTLAQKGELQKARIFTFHVADLTDGSTIQGICSYNLANCGWKTRYRLDAHPEQNNIVIVQEAEIRQASGQDWNETELVLSTGNPDSPLNPSELGQWILQPRRQVQPRDSRMRMSADEGMMLTARMSRENVPVDEEHQTSTFWNLGIHNVPTGTPIVLSLQKNTLPAQFVRLARPSLSRAVFLQAKLEQEQIPFMMTTGKAKMFLEGIPVGESPVEPGQNIFYFGTDPYVGAEMILDTRKSGQKGILEKRQTHVWSWKGRLSNRHSNPVLVRVEDPAPRSGDDSIAIAVTSTPAANEKDHILFWEFMVPANGEQLFEHTVSVTAPQNMDLDVTR